MRDPGTEKVVEKKKPWPRQWQSAPKIRLSPKQAFPRKAPLRVLRWGPQMVTMPPRGDRAGAKPHGVASPHTPRVARAREGLVDAPPARGGAARARGDARIALALFSVSLLWCSSLSASEALVDLFLPPAGRPAEASVVADAASLLAAHAARAERDLAKCAERQTRACVRNVRLDAEAESRRADDVAARNDAVAELAAAVSETCVALDARVGDALRVVAARRAPEDLPWRSTRNDAEENAASDAGANAATRGCSARDRAATRARAAFPAEGESQIANASTPFDMSMADALANASATYRVAADAYRAETEAAVDAAAAAVTSRAAYDRAYAANKTSALAAARAALEHNVTAELVALVRLASESLGALDADAGAKLRAVASDAAEALAETRDEVQAAARAYVASVRAYVADVSAQLAEAKAWFDTFAGIGSVVKSMLGDLATSLPSVDAPAPPALRVAELSPQVVPDVSAAVAAAGAAGAAAADAVAAAADAARLRLANAAARVPAAFETPTLAVFADYDPPPRETHAEGSNADDPGGVRAASAFAASARGDADARWSRFSAAVDAAADAVDAERESLNASRTNTTETFETFEREVTDLEDEVASSVSQADLAGTVASFAAASAERLDASAANASAAAAAAAEWLGVAGPDVGAWRAAVAAVAAAADGLAGADLAYRFARSFQHVARHFEGSTRGRLPPVDLTVGAAAAAAAASRGSGPRRTALMSAAAAIGHPACQAVVRVAAVALVTALVTNAYLPFHDAYRPFWAPSSVTNASAPRVYQRVVCHEIRSKLSPPMDCSGASTRFLASRKVAPPPAPPQRRSSMRADPPAGRISRNASLGSHDAWRRRATRRTRWLVVQGRRFPSTAGMDSGEINTRVSDALCGRRSEGTAFASSAAGRWRHTSWH